MKYIPRRIEAELSRAARNFSAVILTGPRRAGENDPPQKNFFPKAQYYLLEDPDAVSRLRADPRSFIEEIRPRRSWMKSRMCPRSSTMSERRLTDSPKERASGYWTGSQDVPLMKGVTESMTGRAAVFQLFPSRFRRPRRFPF